MRKTVIRAAIVICIAVIVLSSIQLLRIYAGYKKSTEMVAALKSEVAAQSIPPQDTMDSSKEADSGAEEDDSSLAIADKFQTLYEKNNDFIGWMAVDATNIDYPVMQSRKDPELYLRHDFNKEYDIRGTIYLDSQCDLVNGNHLIVYGHNSTDGTMFSQLEKFTDPDFCQEAHLITLDTIYGTTTWKPVLVCRIDTSQIETFPYHTMTQLASPSDYIYRAKDTAIWYSNNPVPDEARLLTLSTCDYTLSNGRLLVIAEQVVQ